MNRDLRRAVLEAIVLSVNATPGDRLRAIEHLERYDQEERQPFADEVDGLSEEELDAEWALLVAPVYGGEGLIREACSSEPENVLARLLHDILFEGERFPDVHAAFVAEIDRRAVLHARTLSRGSADSGR